MSSKDFKIKNNLDVQGGSINLSDKTISADEDGIKVPSIKIGSGGNEISLSASASGKLIQTAKVGGVAQSPVSYTIEGLDNTTITTPADGQVLSYDTTNTEWVNTSPVDAYTKTEVDTAIGNVTVDLSAYDTSAQVDTKVAGIVDSAPATLDTLNELAAALGDDANHVTTMTTLVGTKADQSTTYTKTEVDTSLNLKSDTTHTHDYAASAHTHTNSIDHLTDVDVTTAAPTTDQVLKYDGTNWVPGDDVAGSGGTTSIGGTYTAGVIWDNHDSTRAEHDVALSVVSGATLALTHDADTEELRSVYIEKFVEIPGGAVATKKIVITASHPSGMTYNAFGGLKFRDSSNNIIPITGGIWISVTEHTFNELTITSTATYQTMTRHSVGHIVMSDATDYNGAETTAGTSYWIAPDGGDPQTITITFTTPISIASFDVVTFPNYSNRGSNLSVQFLDENLTELSVVSAPQNTSVHTASNSAIENFTTNIATLPGSTYWQLESFDDWGVQFTDSTTTTLINNTGDDAVIRARLTKPTALASTSGTSTTTNLTAGVIWDNHDSSRAEHDVSLSVDADATLALTHDADTEELRSVYIEKYVEIPSGIPNEPSATKLVLQGSLTDLSERTTVTNSGVTTSPTQQKWTGTNSLYFDGSGQLSASIVLGTNDFTIELWVYQTDDSVYRPHLWDSRTSDPDTNGFAITSNPDNWAIFTAGGFQLNGTSTPILHTWQHVAYVRSGDTHTLYVDGSVQGTWTPTISPDYSNSNVILGGYYVNSDYNLIGYMDDYIVHSGLAKYSSSFTPPGRYEVTYAIGSTYWQLESFDDWGVQFTDSTTTTLINNTGADATIRARLTKPTALASTSGTNTTTNLTAGVIWDNHDSSRAEHDESLTVLADGTSVLTHASDTEELRSVYIEKYVDIPSESGAVKKIIFTLSKPSTAPSTYYLAFGGLTLYSSPGVSIPITNPNFVSDTLATFDGISVVSSQARVSAAYHVGFPLTGDATVWDGGESSGYWRGLYASHTVTIEFDTPTSITSFDVITNPDTTHYGNRGADLSIQFLDENLTELSVVSVPEQTAVATAENHLTNIATSVGSTYWQLESFDDWGVQFTSPTTTTLVNNTTADAVIRARITKPTSVSTNAYGALELTADGSVISPTAGLVDIPNGTTKAITHASDASNLRSVYIEKYVEVPGGMSVEHKTKKIRIVSTQTTTSGALAAVGLLRLYSDDNYTTPSIDLGTRTDGTHAPSATVGSEAVFSGGVTIWSVATYGTTYAVGKILDTSDTHHWLTSSNNQAWVDAGSIGEIFIEFDSPVDINSFTIVTNPITYETHESDVTLQFYNDANILIKTENVLASDWDSNAAEVQEPVSMGLPVITGATYWQLETYNDWGVQFTDSTTTTITNNTGADATARFRITAPTAAASSSSGGGATTLAELTDSTTDTTDPLTTSNLSVGHLWINSTSGEVYVCTDATTGANIWINIGDGTGNITPNDPPTNPTNIVIEEQYIGSSFDHTFTGGTDTDGNVTHYIVDEITGTASGNVVANPMTVAVPEVPVGVPHQFTVGSLSDTTSISFRVRSKDNNGSYSDGVTVTFSGTIVPSYFGGRGLFGGGYGDLDIIDYVTISTQGNATNFSDLTVGRSWVEACSDGTRGLFAGGGSSNIIDYVTISTAANSVDFGDLTIDGQNNIGACSDGIKGLFASGDMVLGVHYSDIIDYVTISTLGNAIVFGNLYVGRNQTDACSDGTKGIFAGGYISQYPSFGGVTHIDYVTIATTSAAEDFGDLTHVTYGVSSCSDGTRGLFGGGVGPLAGYNGGYSASIDDIDYITISTLGNAVNFGNLIRTTSGHQSCSDGTKGLFGGGSSGSTTQGYSTRVEIDFVTISTTGNAVNFGNLTVARGGVGSCSGD